MFTTAWPKFSLDGVGLRLWTINRLYYSSLVDRTNGRTTAARRRVVSRIRRDRAACGRRVFRSCIFLNTIRWLFFCLRIGDILGCQSVLIDFQFYFMLCEPLYNLQRCNTLVIFISNHIKARWMYQKASQNVFVRGSKHCWIGATSPVYSGSIKKELCFVFLGNITENKTGHRNTDAFLWYMFYNMVTFAGLYVWVRIPLILYPQSKSAMDSRSFKGRLCHWEK